MTNAVRRNAAVEAAVAVAIFAAAAWWGASYWRASLAAGRQPIFYQEYFESAVMTACGRGFTVSAAQPQALVDFLWRRRDTFSCAELPASLDLQQARSVQAGMRYLQIAVGLTWRVLGISWSGLGPLCGLLFGVSAAAAYGIFRLAMPRALAAAGATAFAVSTVQLRNAPHLRDYAKAPFVLTLIVLLAWILRGKFGPRAIAFGAAYGAVAGLAYGFRPDVLVCLPLFVIALVGFVDGGILRNLGVKGVTAAAMFAAFFVTAWPAWSGVRARGGCEWHVITLGFASRFDDDLRLERTGYAANYPYSDEFVYRAVTSYAARDGVDPDSIALCSPAYDAAGRRYFLQIAKLLPADLLVRAFASARGMWDLPFRAEAAPLPSWHPWLYRARARGLMLLAPIGAVAMLAMLVLLTMRSVRWGLSACLVLAYLGGYPALQSDERHYFYLEVLEWWALGALVTMAIAAFRGARFSDLRLSIRNTAIAALAVAAVLVLPLLVLRSYQQRELRAYFGRYVQAPKMEPGKVGRQELIEADVDASCGPSAVVTAQYDDAVPPENFSWTFPASAAQGITRVFVPVYSHFKGVIASDGTRSCPVTVSRIADVRPFPVLMAATLPPGWERMPLYQRFR